MLASHEPVIHAQTLLMYELEPLAELDRINRLEVSELYLDIQA